MIAACGKVTVAEVEELVEIGELDPDAIDTPGIYVDRIIQGEKYEKRIEFRTISGQAASKKESPMRVMIAQRAAKELKDGYYVNLGIGIPTMVANYIPAGVNVTLQSENGLLGIGPFPTEDKLDPDLINAGKQTVTTIPGSSFFSSAESFAMIRGGHVDLAILGAMQVSAGGDLANWAVPGGKVMGIGGAMDLASGCRRLIVMMQHTTKKKEHKLVQRCEYPLTATRVVSLVITDLGVFEPTGHAFRIIELAPGVTRDQAEAATGAPLLDA
jgi:3-oxoacid CoA-transferase